MGRLPRCSSRLGAVLFAAVVGSAGAAPDPLHYQRLLGLAVQQALVGDAAQAIVSYQQVLAALDQGLPIDRVTATRLVAGLLHAYERAGRPDEAIAFLESSAFVRTMDLPWRPQLCRLYLKRQALDKAESACRLAQEEETRRSLAQPPAQLALAGRVLTIRQSLLEIGNAVADPGTALMRQADQTGNTAFSKPEESFLRSLSPHALLARLYAQRADRAALLGYYQGGFARYAGALDGRLGALDPATGFPPLEDDYARFGALLGSLDAPAEAEQAMRAALRLNAVRTRFVASQYNPALLAGTMATRRAKVSLLVSLALRQDAPQPQALAAMAGELMQSKGALSELLALRHSFIMRSKDTELAALYKAAETAAANRDEAAWKAASLQLDGRIRAYLPPTLFDDGAEFVARLKARLGDETLVSVIRYAPFDFAAQAYAAPHYLVLCLRGGALQARDIGPVDELDLMVQRYRAEASAAPRAGTPRLQALARQLYTRILAPVLGEALPAGRYVADLDGLLNLLPLEALVDGAGRHLLEAGTWRYTGSARALLRGADAAPAGGAGRAVLLVDPAFSATPPRRRGAGSNGEDNPVRRALAAAAGRFAALPETREEGRQVGKALRRMGVQPVILAGRRADAATLAELKAPRFLHIATHGFFLDETAVAPGQFSAEAASGGMDGGIALAGSNAAAAVAQGDGLVFIGQFRTLDLDGTEMVVLSACDTGVGSVRNGEGLNSLRHGIELAGARAQVTALWKVPSAATVQLMAQFYGKLADGASKAQALRQAKLAILKTHPNPLYWAGFTFTGQER